MRIRMLIFRVVLNNFQIQVQNLPSMILEPFTSPAAWVVDVRSVSSNLTNGSCKSATKSAQGGLKIERVRGMRRAY